MTLELAFYLNEPNYNHRIYTEQLVEKLKERVENGFLPLVTEVDFEETDLTKVVGSVTKIIQDGDKVFFECDFNKNNPLSKHILEDPENLYIIPNSIGETKEDLIIVDEVISCSFYRKGK